MARFGTITVRDLIEALQQEDQDAQVVFTANYGDYSNTPQALAIDGEIEEVTLEKSAYSRSGWAIAREGDEESDVDEDSPKVLVIR